MSTDATALEARIDPRQALASLGYPDVSEPRRVRGGWDTFLWRFATPDGREHSLRVYPQPQGERVAWREQIALDACDGAGLPAPRVEASGQVEGLPALVLSWCPGRPLLSYVEQTPWAIWRLGRLFGRTQARVHAVAPPPQLAASPDDWLRRVPPRYSHLAEHARSLGLHRRSLLHMDFHPLNLVSDGRVVTGILDWANAAAGDPRADMARTEITILAAPIPPGPLRPFLNLLRGLLLRAWRSGYQELAGPMPDFGPLRAWAAATLLAEVELVVGRPHVWGTEDDLGRLRRLIESWSGQAGIAAT